MFEFVDFCLKMYARDFKAKKQSKKMINLFEIPQSAIKFNAKSIVLLGSKN